MSEPIQSISKGNYILQGTVATSAGIVGDGSTQNTLRADETVLWSGERNWWADTSALTVSENMSNFETIKIVAKDDWSLSHQEFYFPGANASFDISLIGEEGGDLVIKSSKFGVNGNNISLISKTMIGINSNKTISTNFGKSFIQFNKIVGINRIAGGN